MFIRRSARVATAILAASALGGCSWFSGSAPSLNSTDAPAPRSADDLVNSAENAARAGDTRRALRELERAIEINPRLTRAHMSIADIHRADGDYSAAQSSYHRAAEVEPRNFDAQYFDGLMLHLLDRVTEAIAAYLRALAVRPNDFQANLNLAAAYYQLDENRQALEYAARAVRLSPTDGQARAQLAAVHAALDDHVGAVREYQQAAELLPLTPSLLLNFAESLRRLDRYEEMRNAVEQALRIEPSAAAWERLGFADFKLGNYDKAMTNFENALAADPDYFPALNGRGVSLLNRWITSGHADEDARRAGVASLRRSLQVNPLQPQIAELLGRYGF